MQLYKKEIPSPTFSSCEFRKVFTFFKNTSGQTHLEKHWNTIKTAPIAIPVIVSNASYGKGFVLFRFLRFAYNKFLDISMKVWKLEVSMEVSESFSSTLRFPTLRNLTNMQIYSVI